MTEKPYDERLVEEFLTLLARGVIQFGPEESRELSTLDWGRIIVRIVAKAFAYEGHEDIKDALLKAIEDKSKIGRPEEWQRSDILNLWSDVMHLARSNPELRARAIFDRLARSAEWEGPTSESLRQKFRDGARKIGLTESTAIAALRNLGR